MAAEGAGCDTGTAGADVDRNVSSMQGDVAIPRSNGEILFEAPWQSRAFGMAVSLSQAGYFPWDTFRAELAAAIRDKGQDGTDDYWLRWLDALEASLGDQNVYDADALHAREHEYRHHERDEVF